MVRLKIFAIFAATCLLVRTGDPMSLNLTAPIEKWDEAVALGNGILGGLLWGAGNEIRLSLDRGDLWDLRPHPAYVRSGFSYKKVVELAQAGRTDELNREYACVSDFPTKLPGARLVLTLDPNYQVREFRLDMKRAEGLANYGNAQARCFFSAVGPVAFIFVPGKVRLRFVPNDAVRSLGYQPAAAGADERAAWLVQDAALGFRYAVFAASQSVDGGTLVVAAITTNREDSDPLRLARQRTGTALTAGYEKSFALHTAWWKSFWARSAVTIPDAKIQQHYNLVRYLLGSASRRGAPPMPLQGVWTADEGKLPPWHGDYHNDLNTQLTYWPYLASGDFEEGLSFLDFMWNLKPKHEEFARRFYGLTKGMVVPGVMALDGAPMGAWFQYTLSPTMGAWVAQAFCLHWRYEAKRSFLSERAYPYCAAVGEALSELLNPMENGFLRLPLSTSPEIHNNSQRAWFNPNSNFDLSLMRWLFAANMEMATELDRPSEAAKWKELLSRLPPFAVDAHSGALSVAPGEPLAESHRHHSHLMAIHPLGILSVEGSDRDRALIRSSFAQVDRLGTRQWCGYSFSWMAAMRARAGDGNGALRYLSDYVNSFILRNGFHANGEQTRKGLSDFHDRPFTLEGNFAAAQAVHEMLLQSWGGKLRVFPAVPWQWSNVSFQDLRAEGGFSVTAERRGRHTRRISVRASVPQTLRLQDPFEGREYLANRKVEKLDQELRCHLKAGETLELKEVPPKRPKSALACPLKWVGVAVEEPGYTVWGASPILAGVYKISIGFPGQPPGSLA